MSNKYKMIVMDMDYTLLNSKKEISERNMTALRLAAEKGLKIVVATGRIYSSAKHFGDLISTNAPVIASNGAIIRNRISNHTFFKKNLDTNTIVKILEIAKKYEIDCHLFSDDTIFAEKFTGVCENYIKWNDKIMKPENIVHVVPDSTYPKTVIENEGKILKIVAVDEDDRVEAFRRDVRAAYQVSISQSLRNNIEIMGDGVSKGNAALRLADYYGIRSEEVIAIGDNENDISMIDFAGLGVAMENAEDCLKERAGFITSSCDDSGVAKVIEEFVL